MHEPKLTIDVGGILHFSTRPTLAKSSVLDTVLQQSQDGECPFVDRDGILFYHVLAYLRNGTVPPNDDKTFLKLLMLEAGYYRLRGMETQIGALLHDA